MAHVELRRINKKFRRHTALDDLSLDVGDGEFFVLLGPTGAGKTTTLRLIAGLDAPDSGSILIEGEDVGQWSAAERDVALVFQYYSLYPHYTVRENLEFPLKSRRRRLSAEEVAARVTRAAQTLRIEHLLERKTDRLSGGEMQRVSIGRAIVRQPRVFLMDEPLSQPGRQIARDPARGAQGPADEGPRHLPLRHPRSGRGHEHGRQDRRAEWRPHRPDRNPVRDLQSAARHLRGHLCRLAGHEPAVRRVPGWQGGRRSREAGDTGGRPKSSSAAGRPGPRYARRARRGRGGGPGRGA